MEKAHRQRKALEEKAATLTKKRQQPRGRLGLRPTVAHDPSKPSKLYSPTKNRSGGGLFVSARHDMRARGPEETPLDRVCRRLKDDDTDEHVIALSGFALDAAGAARLADAAKKNITMVQLDLTECSLGPEGAAALSDVMLTRNMRLEVLDVSDNAATLGPQARHDSAEDFSRLDALLFTAMAWIFIPAYCSANP